MSQRERSTKKLEFVSILYKTKWFWRRYILLGIINVIFFRISVRLGEYNTDTDVDCVNNQGFDYCSDPPQNVAVEEQIAHERYDPLSPNQEHDIALLRLVRNVTYSGNYLRF